MNPILDSPSGTRKSVPLRWRLVNPPAVFVGREAEVARMEQLMARGPLTILCGPGGCGKSALVAQVLRTHRKQRTLIRVGMRPTDDLAQLCIAMLKAAFEVVGRTADDWSNAARNMSMLMSTVIDVAEEHALFFVLEDLHNGEAKTMDAFMVLLHSYGHDSRWIITTRRTPTAPEICEQVCTVQPLSDAEAQELGQRCAPDQSPAEIKAMVEHAQGSPWALRQMVGDLRPSKTGAHEQPTSDTDLLRALSLLELPMPVDALARVAEVPDETQLASLVDNGFLEAGGSHMRLHDRSRRQVRDGLIPEEVKAMELRLVEGLKSDERSAPRLEALRLAMENDESGAHELLTAHAIHLIGRGHAPRLWRLLSSRPEATYDPWRFRLALHLGSGEAIRWALAQAEPENVALRMAWMTVQHMAGRIEQSLAVAETIEREARESGDLKTAFLCSIQRYRALTQQGQSHAAYTILETIEAPDEAAQTLLEAFKARTLVLTGRYEEGLQIARRITLKLDALPGTTAREIQGEVASAFILLGRLTDAGRILGEGKSGGGNPPVHSISGRIRQLFLDVRRGRLEEANKTIRALDEGPETVSILKVFVGAQGSVVAAAMGDFERAILMIEQARGEARQSRNAYMYQWCAFARLFLDWHRGEAIEDRPAMEKPSDLTGPQQAGFAAIERAQNIRFGRTFEKIAPTSAVVEANIINFVGTAEHAMIEGELDAALSAAQRAVQTCETHGLGLLMADGIRTLCDVHLLRGERAELASQAERLNTHFTSSKHYQNLADFYSALADGPSLSGRDVWHWSRSSSVSPLLAGRCASWLNRQSKPRHRLDAVIVKCLLERHGRFQTSGTRDGEPWGLDMNRKVLWSGPEEVSLQRHRLAMRFLICLARQGGQASKAELAHEVWDVQNYHPFNDDKRIQVAVRRIRQIIGESNPPERILTREDGYALCPGRPFILLDSNA